MTDKYREEVTAAFAFIDAYVAVPPFRRQWLQASLQISDASAARDGRGERFVGRLRRWLPDTSYGTVILTLLIFMVALMVTLSLHETREVIPQTISMTDPSVPETLDLNLPWVGLTDELLTINVRDYESQWFTHVIYDPLTMEIK